VETQIHGGLEVSADVTAVVADPCFIGTDTAAHLASLATDLRWHPGFGLDAGEFPAALRGPVAPRLAAALAAAYGTDRVDAAVIGRAAREPAAWSRFGAPAEVLQQLKYLWHILVLLGRPA
jgi:hypothetical protein